MPKKIKYPMQPLWQDDNGTIRFKGNMVVMYLLGAVEEDAIDMNNLATMGFSDEDMAQFAQLIGYTVSGYGDLSYAKRVKKADKKAAKLLRPKS